MFSIQREEMGSSFSYEKPTHREEVGSSFTSSPSSSRTLTPEPIRYPTVHSNSWQGSGSAYKEPIQKEELGTSFSYEKPTHRKEASISFSYGEPTHKEEVSSSFTSSPSSSRTLTPEPIHYPTVHSNSWQGSGSSYKEPIQKEEVGTSFSYEKPTHREEASVSFSYGEPTHKEEVGSSFSYEKTTRGEDRADYNELPPYSSSRRTTHTYTHIPKHSHTTHHIYSQDPTYLYPNTFDTYYGHYPSPISFSDVLFVGGLICLGAMALSVIFSSKSQPSSPPPPTTKTTTFRSDTFTKPTGNNCVKIYDTLLNCPYKERVSNGITQVWGKACKWFKYAAQGSTPCQIKEEECKCTWRAI